VVPPRQGHVEMRGGPIEHFFFFSIYKLCTRTDTMHQHHANATLKAIYLPFALFSSCYDPLSIECLEFSNGQGVMSEAQFTYTPFA